MPLPLLAGLFLFAALATGAWVRFRLQGHGRMRLLLAFSGAFLLAVTVSHMLPEVYVRGGHHIGNWLLAGFVLQLVLEYFSRGIEHGHIHHEHDKHSSHRIPLGMLASLCIHSFVEGLPFADPHVSGDPAFVAGVILHKLPMAVALATLLHATGTSATRSWVVLAIFAAAAPAGILVGDLIGNGLGATVLVRALAVAIGMLLHISTTIIFETAPGHRFDGRRTAAILAGLVIGAWLAHAGH